MNLELTDEQTEALARLLSQIIDGDRYPLSRRVGVLNEILAKLRLEPEREPPPPPPKLYAPSSKGRWRPRRG